MTQTVKTTAPTGLTLDLRHAQHAAAGVQTWGTKAAALAALAALRECGRNLDRDIEVHRAETFLWRFWVIGRPDHFNGVTYLMTADGRWVPGRLTDAPCFCSEPCKGHQTPWTQLPGDPQPATVTHDYAYSAGSVGVAGHDGKPLMTRGMFGSTEVLAWSTHVWCIACTWSRHDSHEDSVRSAARWHRAHPTEFPDHATPRRLPAVERAR
jgi:hypothetical protein